MKWSILRSKRLLGSLLVAGMVLVPVSYSPAKGFTTNEACAGADCCQEMRSICDGYVINAYYSLRGCNSKIFNSSTSTDSNS